MALDASAARAHSSADAAPALETLLGDLRRALAAGAVTVEVPVVLAGDERLRVRAGSTRNALTQALTGLVAAGEVDREDAKVLVERYALDGRLREPRAVAEQHGFGRETMRLRYRAAMERLADQLARMPLALAPPVELAPAQKELVVASVLGDVSLFGSVDAEAVSYIHRRVRQRVLATEAPGPPGRGRAEDRRLQRAADQLAAVVEDRVDRGAVIATLPRASEDDLGRLRSWIASGQLPEHSDLELSRAYVAVALHGQAEHLPLRLPALGPDADDDDSADFAFEAAFGDLSLPVQLAAIKTARATAKTRLDWAMAGLLHYYLAEGLADRGYPAAAEHVMRAVTDPLKRLLQDEPAGTAFLADMYLIRRFQGRVSLHLGRGPQALAPLRATLRSFFMHSTRLPEGLDFYEGVRLRLALVNTEIAAMLAGADPEESRVFFGEMSNTLQTTAPEPLDRTIDRSITRALADLQALWDETADHTRPTIASRLATRISGPEIESKASSALVVRRWTDPR